MRSFFLFILVVLFVYMLPAQECSSYFPFKEGTKMEQKSYSDKDKVTSTTKSTITNKKISGSNIEISVKAEVYDEKDKLTGSPAYTVKCENGTLLIDMRSMMSEEQLKSFQNAQVKIEGDNLDIPPNPSAGQKLKDGTITVSMSSEGGPTLMNLRIAVTNRKAEGTESITTPAGTFECVKISYDVETKMLFPIRTHAVEWYAKNTGMVRSETYNAKGKLQGYTVLTAFH